MGSASGPGSDLETSQGRSLTSESSPWSSNALKPSKLSSGSLPASDAATTDCASSRLFLGNPEFEAVTSGLLAESGSWVPVARFFATKPNALRKMLSPVVFWSWAVAPAFSTLRESAFLFPEIRPTKERATPPTRSKNISQENSRNKTRPSASATIRIDTDPIKPKSGAISAIAPSPMMPPAPAGRSSPRQMLTSARAASEIRMSNRPLALSTQTRPSTAGALRNNNQVLAMIRAGKANARYPRPWSRKSAR